MWEMNINQESVDSNLNILISEKPHGHRGVHASSHVLSLYYRALG